MLEKRTLQLIWEVVPKRMLNRNVAFLTTERKTDFPDL